MHSSDSVVKLSAPKYGGPAPDPPPPTARQRRWFVAEHYQQLLDENRVQREV